MSALKTCRKSQAIHLLSFLALARWLLPERTRLCGRGGEGAWPLTSSGGWVVFTRPRPRHPKVQPQVRHGRALAGAQRRLRVEAIVAKEVFWRTFLHVDAFWGFVEYHWIRTRLVVSQVYHRWNKMQSFDLLICHHQSHLKANHPEL